MIHYTQLNFSQAQTGTKFESGQKEFTLLKAIDSGNGEGFAVAFDSEGEVYIFCSLEGGYAFDCFNFSEVMRDTVVTEYATKRLYNNILDFVKRKMIETEEEEE